MLGEGKSGKFNDNSPSRCLRFCEEYKYYGVESEKECFCGNKIKYEEPKPQNKCNKKCPGKSIMCGGKWHLNVYINCKTTQSLVTSKKWEICQEAKEMIKPIL